MNLDHGESIGRIRCDEYKIVLASNSTISINPLNCAWTCSNTRITVRVVKVLKCNGRHQTYCCDDKHWIVKFL